MAIFKKTAIYCSGSVFSLFFWLRNVFCVSRFVAGRNNGRREPVRQNKTSGSFPEM